MKKKKKQNNFKSPLQAFGVRLDSLKMIEAHELGIDTGVLFRAALDQELREWRKKCPTCGVAKDKLASK